MADEQKPLAQLPLREQEQRIERASRLLHLGQPIPPEEADEEALRRIEEIEEELDLLEALNGFDALKFAEAQEAHFLTELKAYLRGRRQARKQLAAQQG